MSKSNIEWTDRTWNPVIGCSKISTGCNNCYAEKMAHRLKAMGTKGYENEFAVTLHPDRIDDPLKRRKPTVYFVCSMGDLFHDDVPFEFIDKILTTILRSPRHTYLILTKRPERMKEYFTKWHQDYEMDDAEAYASCRPPAIYDGKIKNLWLGVTAENQEHADKRIPILLDTPAFKRFVSIEPMLSKINLFGLMPSRERDDKLSSVQLSMGVDAVYDDRLYINALRGESKWYHRGENIENQTNKLDWVICGGETGAYARGLHPDWVRSLKDQCEETQTPFFFKKWGEWIPIEETWKIDNAKRLQKNEQWVNLNGGSGFHGAKIWRVKKVGRSSERYLIDGKEYRQFPKEIYKRSNI